MTHAAQKFRVLRMPIKEVRDDFSEEGTLDKKSEGHVGFNCGENGNKSIPGRGTLHAKALWQRSHGESDISEANGSPVEKARQSKELKQIGWLCRALQSF